MVRKVRSWRVLLASVFVLTLLLILVLSLHSFFTSSGKAGPYVHLQNGRAISIAGWIIYGGSLPSHAQFYVVNNPRSPRGTCVKGVNVTYPPAGTGAEALEVAYNPSLCLSIWERFPIH